MFKCSKKPVRASTGISRDPLLMIRAAVVGCGQISRRAHVFGPRRRSTTVSPGDGATFCLAVYDAVGFDLDNTLARYRLPALFELIHGSVREHLDKGVSRRADGSAWPSARGFSSKGVLLDKKRGLLVKFDAGGKVDRAFRGFQRLSDVEVEQLDGEYAGLEFQSDLRPSREWFHFADYFTTPTQALYADMVERTKPETSAEPLWHDLLGGIIRFYRPDGPRARTLLQTPDKIVQPCPKSVTAWIQSLREAGTRTFLVTGSEPALAVAIASHALGPQWQDLFDLVILGANKPAFFSDASMPFKAGFKMASGRRGTCTAVPSSRKRSFSLSSWSSSSENDDSDTKWYIVFQSSDYTDDIDVSSSAKEEEDSSEENITSGCLWMNIDIRNIPTKRPRFPFLAIHGVSLFTLQKCLCVRGWVASSPVHDPRLCNEGDAFIAAVVKEDGSLRALGHDEQLKPGVMYCGGNWTALREHWLGSRRALYIGDSLVDDTVAAQGCCDSVAVVEELAAEPLLLEDAEPSALEGAEYLLSKAWGSVFVSARGPSYFTKSLCEAARLAISDVSQLTKLSRSTKVPAFDSQVSTRGFYPSPPKSLVAVMTLPSLENGSER